MMRYPVVNLGGLLEDYQKEISDFKAKLYQPSAFRGYTPPSPSTPSVPVPAGLSDSEMSSVCGIIRNFDVGTPAEKLTAHRQMQALYDKLTSTDQEKLDQYIQQMCPSQYQNVMTPTLPPPPPPPIPGEVIVIRRPERLPIPPSRPSSSPPPPVPTRGGSISVWSPPPQPPSIPMQTQYPGLITGYPTKPPPKRPNYPPVPTAPTDGTKCKSDETWTPTGCKKNTPTIDTSRESGPTSMAPSSGINSGGYSWNAAPGVNSGQGMTPTPGNNGCPSGMFWDGRQCRGSVGSMPSIPGGGGETAPIATNPMTPSGGYGAVLMGRQVPILGDVSGFFRPQMVRLMR